VTDGFGSREGSRKVVAGIDAFVNKCRAAGGVIKLNYPFMYILRIKTSRERV
jgi:hypothetical protein